MIVEHEGAECDYKAEVDCKCPKCGGEMPCESNAQCIKALAVKVLELKCEVAKLGTKVANLVSQAVIGKAEEKEEDVKVE